MRNHSGHSERAASPANQNANGAYDKVGTGEPWNERFCRPSSWDRAGAHGGLRGAKALRDGEHEKGHGTSC